MTNFSVSVRTLLILSFAAGAAQANNIYSNYVQVSADYPGVSISFPLGINGTRSVVGYYQISGPNDAPHAYEWNNGVTANIDVPFANAIGSIAGGIDANGNVVGTWIDNVGHDHGFLRTLPSGCSSDQQPGCTPQYSSFDVTLTGAIFSNTVATQDGSGTYSNGFVYANGIYAAVDHATDHLDGDGTQLFSVNDSGAIVGDAVFQPFANGFQLTHGFLLSNRVYTGINVPFADFGGFGTQVNGINDSNTVVGIYSDPNGLSAHGLVWTPATSANPDYIDIPGSPFTELHEINNGGDITGAYYGTWWCPT